MKSKYLKSFKPISDSRGSLVNIEFFENISFDVKRAYYLYNLKSKEKRGFHAHRALRQFGICLKGECKILLDDATFKSEIILNKPNIGVLIDPMIWHEMTFTNNSIFLVFANDIYDESDYIRDYEEFKELAKKND